MNVLPTVQLVINKLGRAELSGVNAHTLAVALSRAQTEQLPLDAYTERQIAIVLLDRAVFPVSIAEMQVFLDVNHLLTPTMLTEQITDEHAVPYMRWVAGFLNDMNTAINNNARVLVRWLVSNRASAITADQTALDNMRYIAADPVSVWRSSAYIVYALGMCGIVDDYDRVIYHAEQVIEHDREHIDMVAEALYRLHPPALINAVNFFLERTDVPSRQFTAGMQLLSRTADIDDRSFWKTYYDEMDHIVTKLSDLAGHIPAVERVVDQIEKQLAYASQE